MLGRRRLLQATAASLGVPGLGPAWGQTQARIQFPRDAGSHNDYATEWWYITGYLQRGDGAPAFGFQITFFRSRIAATQSLQSKLAARQLLFAHAAITDIDGKKLWHDQRLSRWSGDAPGQNATDAASARSDDTGIVLRDWSLQREGADLVARLRAEQFSLNLSFKATQPVLLQGDGGISRKGPDAPQFSYYYSVPQLHATGSVQLRDRRLAPFDNGRAWLDHEWANAMLHPQAVGWDWIGINLLDGSALTAFQLRDKGGSALWDGGSFRSASGTRFNFTRGEVQFKPVRCWRSAKSRASYPVEWIVRTPADFYTVKAVIDDQELDSRASTGAIYWEGFSEVWDSNQRLVGRGYLEMTGYASPLSL